MRRVFADQLRHPAAFGHAVCLRSLFDPRMACFIQIEPDSGHGQHLQSTSAFNYADPKEIPSNSMPEMPHPREHHRNPPLVRRVDDFLVA
ncbi:hypothetical protein P3G55_23760, partial [Leptospira sp. 96542]|nr:hypothetical protein [Leptospira sp. 96542]